MVYVSCVFSDADEGVRKFCFVIKYLCTNSTIMMKGEKIHQVTDTVNKLATIIKKVQQCLQCIICLHVISDPVRTPCGHQFCRKCIQTVLRENALFKKSALCPLCNTVIHVQSICTDKPMIEYINKLHNLIQAIQHDSCVNLVPHWTMDHGPCSTRGGEELPEVISSKENPSCSYINSSLEKGQVKSRLDRKNQSRNTLEEKKKMSLRNNIKKYQLASNKLVDYSQSNEHKVQNWLKSLPETKVLDTPIHITEDELDDTLPMSVSQNLDDNRIESFDMESKTTVITDRKFLNRRESEKNELGDKKDNKQFEIGAFTKYLMEKYDFDAGSPRPSTSGTKKPHDNAKDTQGAQTTSLKDNWTSVMQLGKKMRTKKKKFKALNVSIENTRSRSLDNGKKTEVGRSREKNNQSCGRKRNRSDTFEANPKIIFEEKNSPIKERSVIEKEPSDKVESRLCQKSENTSIEDIKQCNSFYITLEGETVLIKNLNDNQISDIVGTVPSHKRLDLISSNDTTIIIDHEAEVPSYEVFNKRATSPEVGETFFAQVASLHMTEKLSSKKSAERKSSEPANVNSQLQALSDLSCQIDQNKENVDASSNLLASTNKGKNTPIVMFKKLGKIYKQFKKHTRFSYLGSIRRETTIPFIYGTEKVWKNFISDNCEIVQLDTAVSSVRDSGGRNAITANDALIDEEERNIAVVKEAKNGESKESIKNTEPSILKENSEVPGKNEYSDVLVISLDVNKETTVAQKNVSSAKVGMLSAMDDSQLQFLSLGSPMNVRDNLETNNLSETPKKSKTETGEKCVCSSGSTSFCPSSPLPQKRRCPSSRDVSPEISKPSEQAMHNFSNKISVIKDNSNQSSLNDGKRHCRRMLPFAPDSEFLDVIATKKPLNDQANSSNKRKRDILSDSDSETDLSMIENWCSMTPNEKYKEQHKVSDLAKVPSEAKEKSFSINRNKISSKLSNHPRKLTEFVDNRSNKESNFNGSQERRAIIPDEDSPDFGSMIDKVKDMKNKAVVSKENTNQCFMQDNFDEFLVNVNTADFMDYDEDINKVTEPICKRKKSSMVISDNSRNKKNDFMISKDEIEKKNMIQENINNTVALTSKTSMKIPANKSTNQILIESSELPKNFFEDDSFMNVTEDHFMLQQFEEDLLGKPLTPKHTFGWESSTPQKLKKNQISSTNRKNVQDVDHMAEDNDNNIEIIQNTPEAKRKNIRLNYSQQEMVMATPKAKISSMDSPSTTIKSSLSCFTPNSKEVQPLCHSTPRTPQAMTPVNFLRRLASIGSKTIDKYTTNIINDENNQINRREQGLCFTCSGLMASQIKNVERLARTVNARYASKFESQVTHVIVRTDENSGANKTLKYLQGIANRKWIVSYQWVIDSIKESRLMNEEQYEAVDCKTLEAGPRKSRLSNNGLFECFAFLCIGPYTNISVEQIYDLLRAMGATVVDSLNTLACEQKLRVIVVQAEMPEPEIVVQWYKEAKAISVDYEWIIECISRYKLISLYPYLQELSQPDALALDFPECLLEDDPNNDSTANDEYRI